MAALIKPTSFQKCDIFINVPTLSRMVCSHFIYYIYPYNIYILGHVHYTAAKKPELYLKTGRQSHIWTSFIGG